MKQKVNADGVTLLENDEYLGIRDGKRMTANQPKNYTNTIHFVGDCVYYGYGRHYDKTVESCLQNLLNTHKLPYKVENDAYFSRGRHQATLYTLNNLKVKPKDIIFFVSPVGLNNIPYMDVTHLFDRPHNYGEVFTDYKHINENGHKALADYIFKVLVSNDFFRDTEFKYPPPNTAVSQVRYTKGKFNIPPELFTKCGIGRIQEKVA